MKSEVKKQPVFQFIKYSVLALIPVLSIYKGVWFIELGSLILLVIMVADIIRQKGNIEVNKRLLIVLSALVCLNITTGFIHMSTIDITGTMNNSIDLALKAVIFAYYIKKSTAEADVFFKYISAVAIAASIFIIVQYILYTRGIIVIGYFRNLVRESLRASYVTIPIMYGRPNSIFLEPAHYSTYVLPVFALSLFRKKFIPALVMIAGIIVSTSTTGIAAAIIIAVVYTVRHNNIPTILKWTIFIAGVTVLAMNISAFTDVSVFEKLRFSSMKDNIRVFGAFQYFKHYGPIDVLFGAGHNRLAEFVRAISSTKVDNGANALIFSFLGFGIVGGFLWNGYLASLFKLSRNKMLFLIFVMIYVTDQIIFNRNLFYLLLLIFVFSNEEHGAPVLKDGET